MNKSDLTKEIKAIIERLSRGDTDVWLETIIEREQGFYVHIGFETGEYRSFPQSYGEVIKEPKTDCIQFTFLKNGDLEDLDCKIRELFDKIDLDKD